MNSTSTNRQTSSTHKSQPMLDLVISILIPSFILMKMSDAEQLGASGALLLALAFPLSWGAYEIVKYRKFNFIALLGLISVTLTGGIGLLQLDTQWLAIKEAAIPGIIGMAILISTRTPYPLIKTLMYNPKIINVEKIQQILEENNHQAAFEKRLLNATYLLSGTFLFSSIMNYLLAKLIVTSPGGSAAFNEQLGQMTLLSYPVIAIPSMLMMMAILYYLWRSIHNMTGLPLEKIFISQQTDNKN